MYTDTEIGCFIGKILQTDVQINHPKIFTQVFKLFVVALLKQYSSRGSEKKFNLHTDQLAVRYVNSCAYISSKVQYVNSTLKVTAHKVIARKNIKTMPQDQGYANETS